MHSWERKFYMPFTEFNKHLDPEELAMITSKGATQSFEVGEVILQQGKASKKMYMVIEGCVEITVKIMGEGSTIIEKLGPGKFFGEISFIKGVVSPTSAIANNQVKCLVLDNLFFEMLSAYHPATKYKVLTIVGKQVCERLKKMHDKITDIISNSDMTTISFFGELMQSLTTPNEMTFTEANLSHNFLRKLQAFAAFSQEEVDELFKLGIILKAPKHTTLIHAGEMNSICFVVLQGAVQSSIIYNKKIAKLSVIGPETLFSSSTSVYQGLPFTITFTTCENAILFKLSETAIKSLQANMPLLWYKLFDLIFGSLIALEKSIDKLEVRLNIEIYNR